MDKIIDTSRPHAIFFDLDGTLLNREGKISHENRLEIERVKSLGHLIFINTGRSKAHLPKGLADDPLFDGLICGAAYIEYKKEILFRRDLSSLAKRQVLDFAKKNRVPIIFEGIYRDYFYLFPKSSDGVSIGEDITQTDFLSDEVNITKMTFCQVIKDLDTSDITELRVIKFRTYAEGIINGCDKARAMNILLEKIGIPLENTVSFGDSENDIEMLKNSALSVCMPHGADGTKAVSNLILPIDEALRKVFPECK